MSFMPVQYYCHSVAVAPKWIHNGSVARTVTLSVKNVPIHVAKRLKERAARNHRSLQGELLEIIEEASGPLTINDIAALAKRLGLRMPSESAQMIREDRDDPKR